MEKLYHKKWFWLIIVSVGMGIFGILFTPTEAASQNNVMFVFNNVSNFSLDFSQYIGKDTQQQSSKVGSDGTSVIEQAGDGLKAIISSDSCFKPGEINYFSGINSTFDSSIIEYEWLFSDHIQPEQHTTGTVKRDFKEEGKYTATLLVRDNLKGTDLTHFPFEVSYHCLE